MQTVPLGETSGNFRRTILNFAAVVEIATDLALMIDPAIVVKLLLGAEVSGIGPIFRYRVACSGNGMLAGQAVF